MKFNIDNIGFICYNVYINKRWVHLLHAGVASTEENEFESRKSEWPTEVRIGSSPIAHLFYFL